MKLEKIYYLSNNGRFLHVFIATIVCVALLFLGNESFKEIDWDFDFETIKYLILTILIFYFFYKGIKKIFTLITKNIPFVEIHDTHLIFVSYSGKYTHAYRSLFGKYNYSKIEYNEIISLYKNKKFLNTKYPKTRGFIYLKAKMQNNEFDIPTYIKAIDGIELINLKQRLEKKGINVKDML